jgi:hypothetical protein
MDCSDVEEHEEDEDSNSFENEPYDPETHLERLGDTAYAKFIKHLDDDVFRIYWEERHLINGPGYFGFGTKLVLYGRRFTS